MNDEKEINRKGDDSLDGNARYHQLLQMVLFLKESTCSPHYAKLQYGLNPLRGLFDSKKPSSAATFGNNICQLYQQ